MIDYDNLKIEEIVAKGLGKICIIVKTNSASISIDNAAT